MSADKDKIYASIRTDLASRKQTDMRSTLNAERAQGRAESDVTSRRESGRLWNLNNQIAKKLIDSGAEGYSDYIAPTSQVIEHDKLNSGFVF